MLVSRNQPFHSFLSSLVLLVGGVATFSAALQVTPNSKCAAACNSGSDATTFDDIVCYDDEFSQTTNGSRFQECVQCELGSTDVDDSTGMTDVLWGIYNLRFAVSTCVYGYPESKTSLSTPCQVSCNTLSPAVELGIGNNSDLTSTSTSTDLAFCNNRAWDETIIDKCVYCYNWTSSERYMGNFLQSLHNACRVPPSAGSTFPIDPTLIFSSAQVSAPPTTTATSKSHAIPHLSLIIALPVVFGSLIFIATIVCCGFCVRRRRRRMAASGNMDRIHQGSWGDHNIASVYGHSYPSPRGQKQPPAWSKNSPGFASHRNSGMGWAQQLTSLKRSSRGSSNSGPYYEGWGNTFAPASPRDWTEGDQLHERYMSNQPTTTSSIDQKIPLSPPPHPDSKHSTATTTGHQRRTSFSHPFTKSSPIQATGTFPPPPFTQPQNTSPSHHPDLNLQIPAQPALRTQNTNGTSVVSPDDYPHNMAYNYGVDSNNYPLDQKFPTPYHDLSSPESASTDRGARGQTFVFDGATKTWFKDHNVGGGGDGR